MLVAANVKVKAIHCHVKTCAAIADEIFEILDDVGNLQVAFYFELKRTAVRTAGCRFIVVHRSNCYILTLEHTFVWNNAGQYSRLRLQPQ